VEEEDLRDLYSSPSITKIIKSRRMKWARHVARIGEKRNAHRLLVGKPQEKRLLGRPKRRRLDNFKMDIKMGMGSGGVEWIGLARNRNRFRARVNSVMNLRVP
jgi:hypothetical protein